MTYDEQTGTEPDPDEQPFINTPHNPDHFQRVIPLGAIPEDDIQASTESDTDTSSIEIIDASPDEDETTLLDNTSEVEYVTVNGSDYIQDEDGTVTFYDRRRHVLALITNLWKPKLYSIGIVCVVLCVSSLLYMQSTVPWGVSVLALVLVLVCLFVYPTMRSLYWWRNRRITVIVSNWQMRIAVVEPKSRIFNFTGALSAQFIVSGDVSVNVRTTNKWELYFFRKSGGGKIDTKVDEDRALHSLRYIYMPEALRRGVNDAMAYVSDRGNYSH